jgi:amino acid transporter
MTDMAVGTGGVTREHDGVLKRDVGLTGLTMISLGSIIGSGWLLGALNASKIAGGGSLLSWVIAGLILALLALVHAELGSSYPVSGGTARFPYMAFGSLGGFGGGWFAWLQAVTIAPIEVEATLTYLSAKFPGVHAVNANSTLTGKGIGIAAIFMLAFSVINILGVKWLAETNSIAMIWKIAVPTLTFIALLATVFHSKNFTAGGGFFAYGFHGVFAAMPLGGVVFAIEGFEQAIQVGGEARNPQRDIPRAVIGAMIIGTLIYLLLEVAFIGALNPHDLLHGWTTPISGVGSFGPYATLATRAGLGWLGTLLYIDAFVSPAATGLVYMGTASRLSYGLGRNNYFPHAVDRISKRGSPVNSIIIAFVIGMLCFLPFPSWSGLVGLVTSATVMMYAFAPVSLGALRKKDPGRPTPFRLPAAGFLCPLSFVLANLIVYFAGWSTIFWLYMGLLLGVIGFGGYQLAIPVERRTIIDWRAGSWIIPWLLGLAAISALGQYDGVPPKVFGLTLLARHDIPQWWDLAVIAVWSLIIYYWSVSVAMSADKVAVAVADVEAEADWQAELNVAG